LAGKESTQSQNKSVDQAAKQSRSEAAGPEGLAADFGIAAGAVRGQRAGGAAPPLKPPAVLALQRTMGNQAAQRFLNGHRERAAGAEVARRQPSGAEAIVQRQTPPMPNPESVSLSFTLPKNTTLKGGWNDLYAESATTVSFTLNKQGISVNFAPAIIADIQWPLSDQAIGGVAYNVNTLGITTRVWPTQEAASGAAGGEVEGELRSWIMNAIKGTPVYWVPYDYEADPNPLDTLQKIIANVSGGGGSVPENEITRVTLATQLSFANPIQHTTPTGEGARVSGTASVTIRFSGTAATVKDASKRSIEVMELTASSFIITKDGADFARVGRVTLRHGGAVSIGDVDVLHPVSGLESLIRLFGMLATNPLAAAALQANIVTPEMAKGMSPEMITALVTQKITAALAPAITGAIRSNCLIVPDVNICQMLGL
jgi:hypothetical protein